MAPGVTRSWFQRLRLALVRFDASFPIAFKLALPVVAFGVVAVVLGGVFLYREGTERIRSDFEERALLVTKSIEASVSYHELADLNGPLAEELQRHADILVQAEPSILLINAYALQDGTPSLIASSNPAGVRTGEEVSEDIEEDIEAIYATGPVIHEEELAGEPALEISLPISLDGVPALVIGAYFSTADRDQALAAHLREFGLTAGALLLLLPLLIFFLLRIFIFNRLRRMLGAAARMEAGDYSARVDGMFTPDARDEVLRLGSRFNAMADSIQALRQRLEEQATTDELTGLYNRRYVVETLEREIQRSRRRHRPLAVAVVDLDGLKALNDGYGHAAGDHALRQIAEIIRADVRAADVPGRLGGDEFVVVLPDGDSDALHSVLQRIHDNVEELGVVRVGDDAPVRLTVSAGGAFVEDSDTAERLIHRADVALFQAKRAGRNQVRVAA